MGDRGFNINDIVGSFGAHMEIPAKTERRTLKYGISFKTISGEAKSVKDQMITLWLETTLPTILSRYSLENIFNANKFDNCSAHPNVQKLDWVELIIFPPNTTSNTQPMDQGVIRSLKAKYCSLALKKQIAALEKENEMLKFFIFTAMFMLTKAWNFIPDQTFINCFEKSGISLEAVEKHVNDDNNPFCGLDVNETVMENLRDDLELLKTKFDVDFKLTADELVGIDFDVCIANKSSEEDIIAEVSEHDAIETEEESDDECVGVSDNATKPSLNEAMHAVTVLEIYSLYSNFRYDLTKALKDINCVIEMDLKASKKQSTITDFFLKV
ncbi:tigger transposable element-derived protein 4-like [Hydra vulgaris]|uniref:Tigger transposable element-derived protein 4-like n=1 Tax=Hydra vulgaris TaxID=6087 RepID=A0ABM4CB32_HYDVU